MIRATTSVTHFHHQYGALFEAGKNPTWCARKYGNLTVYFITWGTMKTYTLAMWKKAVAILKEKPNLFQNELAIQLDTTENNAREILADYRSAFGIAKFKHGGDRKSADFKNGLRDVKHSRAEINKKYYDKRFKTK